MGSTPSARIFNLTAGAGTPTCSILKNFLNNSCWEAKTPFTSASGSVITSSTLGSIVSFSEFSVVAVVSLRDSFLRLSLFSTSGIEASWKKCIIYK